MAASSGVDETVITTAADDDFAKRGFCCFWVPWPSSVRESKVWERIHIAEGGRCPVATRRFWTRGLRAALKACESYRAVVGRRWKALVRRFRISGSSHRRGFSYDAHSYARNFDEGRQASNHDDDADVASREFSSRFATAFFPSLRRPLVDLSPSSAGGAAL